MGTNKQRSECMNILITGVAGLLGCHLSRYLLTRGYTIFGIDNLSGGYQEYVDARVNFFNIDICDQSAVDAFFNQNRIDYVYHFAAYAAEGLSPFIRNFNYTNNVIGSVNIVNCCIRHSIKKIIFTSSMAVYGENSVPFIETMIPCPVDPYGIAKYTIEQDIRQAHRQFGLDYTIIRPHNVIGIYQNIWDKYRNVIGIWINAAITNNPINVYGDGTQTRAFSDIQFYMDPFKQLLDTHSGQIINVGSDKYFALRDVAEIVHSTAKKFSLTPTIRFMEARMEVKHAYCNHNKAKAEMNFNDQTNIEKTIYEMFMWAITQPQREQKIMKYEIDKNIYSYWK